MSATKSNRALNRRPRMSWLSQMTTGTCGLLFPLISTDLLGQEILTLREFFFRFGSLYTCGGETSWRNNARLPRSTHFDTVFYSFSPVHGSRRLDSPIVPQVKIRKAKIGTSISLPHSDFGALRTQPNFHQCGTTATPNTSESAPRLTRGQVNSNHPKKGR
jgi:hypothetical protein